MPESMDNEKICKLLFPAEELSTSYQMPDYDYIHKEQAKSGVTLSFLWHEYSESCRIGNTIPYKYCCFIQTTSTFRNRHHKILRQ
jgi:hypothetical protein